MFDELLKSIETNEVIVIDVRFHSELQETGIIPNSYSIPCKLKFKNYFPKTFREMLYKPKCHTFSNFSVHELKEAFALEENAFQTKYGFSKPPKDTDNKLIISCRSGWRVRQAVNELDNLGYSNLT